MITKLRVNKLYFFLILIESNFLFAQDSESEIKLETSMTPDEYVDYITGKSDIEVLSPFIAIGDSNVSNETIKRNSGESRSIREVLFEYEEKVQNYANIESGTSEKDSLGMSAFFKFSSISSSLQVFNIENLSDLLSHSYGVTKENAAQFIQYVEAVNNNYTSEVSKKKTEYRDRYHQERNTLGVSTATNNIVTNFNELNYFTSDYYYSEFLAIQDTNDTLLLRFRQDIYNQVSNLNSFQYEQEPLFEFLGKNIDEHYLKLCQSVLSANQ